jgi:hypothetical protein
MARIARLRLSAIALSALPGLAGAAAAEEDLVEKGRDLAERHCIRCHVVREDKPFTGISSTPSFRLLVTALPDWQERFRTFYERRPHPAVVRFRGFTPLSEDEPPTQTVDLFLEDVEAIVAFAESLHEQYEREGNAGGTDQGPDPLLGPGPGPAPGLDIGAGSGPGLGQ